MVRQVLLSRAALLKAPKLFTLTVDRRRFSDPRAAFYHITKGQFVRRLMRDLGITRWVWVLEFQTLTGDGWPHWHLMIDVGDLPRRRVDLRRAWALWRDRWVLGGLDLSSKDMKAHSAEYAILYITKYLTKMPKAGFPAWVVHTSGVRFVQASGGLGPLVFKRNEGGDASKPDQSPAEPKKERGERKTFLEAMSRCRLTSRVWVQEIDVGTGEVRMRFGGSLPCSPGQLWARSAMGEIAAEIEHEVDPVSGKVLLVWKSGVVDEVRKQLLDDGALGWQEKQAASAKRGILAANVFSARAEISGSTIEPG